MINTRLITLAALTSALVLTGCSNLTPTQRHTLGGAAIGAGVGAGIGAITDGNVGTGAAIGAAVGAVGGALTSD